MGVGVSCTEAHAEVSLPLIEVHAPCDNMAKSIEDIAKIRESFWQIILHDTKDSEAPMNIVDSASLPKLDSLQLQKKLRKLLSAPHTKIHLLACSATPPYGEQRKSHWIFSVQIPDLSDHEFFVVIPKSKDQKGYAYGFN